MKLKDIFADVNTKVFVVTDQADGDYDLSWTIEPTDLELLPDDNNVYFVKAIRVLTDSIVDCYIAVITPERIAETVLKRTETGQVVLESLYDHPQSVIPVIASECFGDYELYYSKENPQIGIDILRSGLDIVKKKNIVAQDLGYILRDEGRIEEAIEAFKISEDFDPSNEYTYWELSGLYEKLGQVEKQNKYIKMFEEHVK